MRKLFTLFSLLFPISIYAQITNVTATIQDSSGQLWNSGTYSITFVPTPGRPGPFYWQGAVFVPQVYTGSLSGSGVLSVALPDNFTITPSGSQWAFVLCANTSAPCTTITVPVTGTSEDFSSTFSSRVTPPMLYSSAMPRAYSSAEIYTPAPNQGGQFFSVTTNIPYFWNGTMWISLGGTVSSVGLTLPSLFNCTGSPITTSGTIVCALANQTANTVFAGPSSGSPTTPTFRALTLADLPGGIVPVLYYQTVEANGTAQTQRSTLNFSSNFTVTDSGAPARTNVDLGAAGTAGTYAYPQSITTDSYGRVTTVTAGTSTSPTRHVVTGSRALATAYQNTSTHQMNVAVSIYLTGTYGEDASIASEVGLTSGTLTYSTSASVLNAGGKATLWIEVPAGSYYEVNQDNQYLTNPQAILIGNWEEYY